jgi:hypothetical protein
MSAFASLIIFNISPYLPKPSFPKKPLRFWDVIETSYIENPRLHKLKGILGKFFGQMIGWTLSEYKITLCL